MSVPRVIDWGAFQSAMRSVGFDGRPGIRSITAVNPRFGDGPDDFTHALDVVDEDGETHQIPLAFLPDGEAYR